MRSAFEQAPRATLPLPLHPAGEGMSRRTQSDTFSLDPKRIALEGYYVREPEDDDDFEAFKDTIRARGEIDIPVSVRTLGPLTARKYVLVWGRRRLTAALQLGIAMIPVRTFGEISETDAIKLQLQENLNRRAMTPAETTQAFFELSSRGIPNAEIARTYGKPTSYVSYMVRTGEALAQLSDDERHRLNRSGALKVRLCQDIAARESIGVRVTALRELIASTTLNELGDRDELEQQEDPQSQPGRSNARGGKGSHKAKRRRSQSPTKRKDEESPFARRELRNQKGRSFRVRWTEHDLERDPEAFVRQLSDVLREEIAHLVTRLEQRRALAASGGLPPEIAAQFESARTSAVKLAGWLPSPIV
ncbi:MAG: ParB N-terminal domain-containing protein [Gemmatimonadota bacterium]|nr:ParB N-terminal domain-containing protein [Gemmatimonadota bacterium]